MATANIIVGPASSIPTPPAGEATIFIDTDNNNILSIKDSAGVVTLYSEGSLANTVPGEISASIIDAINCAMKSGKITIDEYGIILGTGVSVTSTTGTDLSGNTFTTVEVGTKGIAVTGMSIDNSPVTIICNGNTEQLTATVLPTNASNKQVKWLSSDTAVATVNINTGLVTAIGTGSCTITAYTDETGYTDTLAVTVNQTGC
jgi:uncharacterized protein YjdB